MKNGVNNMEYKMCYKCNSLCTLDEFNRHSGTKDGWQTQCRQCIKQQRQTWASNNPEKRRARKLRTKYGLSTKNYQDMLDAQGGRCKICGTTETRNAAYEFFPVDHCHKTGKVRGLLCDYCNVGLGRFEDDIERLHAAIKYLQE